DGVERDERIDDLANLARATQQPDVGATVRHDAEVLRRRPAQRAHQGHRLAPRAPAADTDGHAVADLGGDLVDGDAFVRNHCGSILTGWQIVGAEVRGRCFSAGRGRSARMPGRWTIFASTVSL